jgi:large subunit ribosomal protein L15
VGRGPGSGHGKTSCRGQKGQKARSGGNIPPEFEGGQMPLHRRLPKRGFRSPFKKEYALIHVGQLERFEPESVVDVEALKRSGLVKQVKDGVKLLSDGELTKPLVVKVHKASQKAKEKVAEAGGRVEEI